MAERHPFHKLCYVPAGEAHDQILLVVAGGSIQSFDLISGTLRSCWPSENQDRSDESSNDSGSERASKRRKIENGTAKSSSRRVSEDSDASIEILADGKLRQKGERRKPKVPDNRLPNVSHLISTSDGKHIVAVTAEDKAIRVLEVRASGGLKQRSSRCLPKRLCAITLSKDDQTILAADKFGDVYSLPLHPSEHYIPKETPQPEKAYKPAASKLTVHTKGNLDALRQQELQKHIQKRKEGLEFEHKLLIGHVSLLTDLVVAEGDVQGRQRPFILTADRDEHIRVSRGIPQAHIIETFCLGHREFVSKLCILPWDPSILVAGNGEPSLRIFSWQQGKELSVVDLTDVLKAELSEILSSSDRAFSNLAISNIWPIDTGDQAHVVLVGLEGIPYLFTFQSKGSELSYCHDLRLDGNLLDVAVLPDQRTIVISIDDVHEPGSVKTYRAQPTDLSPIQQYQLQIATRNDLHSGGGLELNWQRTSMIFGVEHVVKETTVTNRDNVNENSKRPKVYERIYSPIGEFIYGLENLRKKKGHVTEEEEEDDASIAVTELEGVPSTLANE